MKRLPCFFLMSGKCIMFQLLMICIVLIGACPTESFAAEAVQGKKDSKIPKKGTKKQSSRLTLRAKPILNTRVFQFSDPDTCPVGSYIHIPTITLNNGYYVVEIAVPNELPKLDKEKMYTFVLEFESDYGNEHVSGYYRLVLVSRNKKVLFKDKKRSAKWPPSP